MIESLKDFPLEVESLRTSLASKVKSLALTSKPASPRKCPVLSSRTALFFDLLEIGQGREQCSFVLEHPREHAKKIFFKDLLYLENARILWMRTSKRKPLFFFEIACILRKISKFFGGRLFWRTLSRCVLGFERVCPRVFLCLSFGLEPCVLDYISAFHYVSAQKSPAFQQFAPKLVAFELQKSYVCANSLFELSAPLGAKNFLFPVSDKAHISPLLHRSLSDVAIVPTKRSLC